MATQGDERLFRIHFDLDGDAHRVPAPVLIDSIRGIQRVVLLLAKLHRGEDLGQRMSFSRGLRDEFALQCRVPEPGSYAVPFEIGNPFASAPPVEALAVSRLFGSFTAALGVGDINSVRELVPDSHYLKSLANTYKKALPPDDSGTSYWIQNHQGQRILDSRKVAEPLGRLCSHAEQQALIQQDTISGMLVGMNFEKRTVVLTRPDGKSITAAYDEDSERTLIEHRRGWIQVTGEVRYGPDGYPLSVAHARDLVAFDDDIVELDRLNLYNVPYRAKPPLRFKVTYDPQDQLYDLNGEFGISVSACSRSDLHQELQEALSMLWVEFGQESPDRLSPKAEKLRHLLRKRLKVA